MRDDVLLDTHAWLWMALDVGKIPARVLSRLRSSERGGNLYVAAISLYEVASLASRRRIDLSAPLSIWFKFCFLEPSLRIVPLTPEIAVATTLLPADFHGDPGDRQIAATAMSREMTLCTHDHALIRFGRQGCYPLLKV